MVLKRFRLAALLLSAFLFVFSLPSVAQGQAEKTVDGTPYMRQKKSSSFLDKFFIDLNVGAGTKCSGVTPMSLDANIGYRFFPRAYAFVRTGGLLGLGDEHEGVREYTRSPLLGGGLGYTLCRMDMANIDVRSSVTSSVGNADWKHVAYEATLLFKLGACRSKFYVGLGYRHISSRTAGIGTYNGLVGTLGIGF